MERLESASRDWGELSQRMASMIERLNRFGHTMLSPNNIDRRLAEIESGLR